MDFEKVLIAVGPFGAFQKKVTVAMLLVLYPSMILDMRYAFIHYKPDFHCSLPPWINVSQNDASYEAVLNATIPMEFDSYGVPRRSSCKMYEGGINNQTIRIGNMSSNHSSEVSCKYGYHFDDFNSATAEFEMVCGESWKEALAVAISMACGTSTVLLGYLSDRFGRKPVFLFFKVVHFLSAGLVSLSWSYTSYVAFSVFIDISSMINYGVGYVFASETVGIERRLPVTMAVFLTYTAGYITSPMISYIVPNWRWFLRVISFLGIIYIPLFWYLPESLRWCLVRKKEKKSKILLQQIARDNGKKVDVDDIYKRFQEYQACEKNENIRTSDVKSKNETSYLSQCRVPAMRKRYIAICLSWAAVTMIYHAISFYPSYLSGDRLLNVFYSGLAELPASYLAYKLPQMFGRIRSTSMLYLLSGTCCAIAPFLKTVNTVVVTILVLLGKTAVSTAFDLVYVIASENSPTLVRSTSTGVGSFCGSLGGILVPFLMFAGDVQYDAIPYLTMGICAIVSGILYLFFVPETKAVPMPDSLEMASNNKRIYGWSLCRDFKDSDEATEVVDEKDEYLL